jgi:hypothetical protein
VLTKAVDPAVLGYDRSRSTRVLLTLALLLLVPLLVGNRWHNAPRSYEAAWDQGHVLVFGLWTILLLRRYKGLLRRPLHIQLAIVLGFALIFGGIAELLQTLGGNGPPSPLDMSRNLLGALIGWVFFSPAIAHRPPRYRWAGRVVVAGLMLISLLPLARALVDEIAAYRSFPLLAGFDQPFELDRWSGSAAYKISRSPFAPDNPMLRIDLRTTHYSGVFLNHFPGNWHGYTSFAFSAFNPGQAPLEIICRINDRRHNRDGYHYWDRFNRRLILPPGWSHIRLSIEEIATSPANRRMDMDDILNVGFFTIALPDPRTLFLDNVRLLP